MKTGSVPKAGSLAGRIGNPPHEGQEDPFLPPRPDVADRVKPQSKYRLSQLGPPL